MLAATRGAANYLGAAVEFGELKEGLRADIILLKGNPVSDLANLKELQAVIVRGAYLDKEAINKMLQTAELARNQ